MIDGVRSFLARIGLEKHWTMFHTKGYDAESDIVHLTVADLNTIGVKDPVEIIIILKAAQSHKESCEFALLRWLRQHGLSHYLEGFISSELIHLRDIARLNLPDEDLYDELEIILPGHQRRLERAVCSLRNQTPTSEPQEANTRLVTEGWWGFPSYLPGAKYPFLCVNATIVSARPQSTPRTIDFMVDSGSDVSTLREDIIQELNLESITTVRSCGVYGSQRTTMYRAHITIGDCKLEIEVIGSSYDSLGSRVLRHFRHSIDNNVHKWLRETEVASTSGQEVETVSVLPSNSSSSREMQGAGSLPIRVSDRGTGQQRSSTVTESSEAGGGNEQETTSGEARSEGTGGDAHQDDVDSVPFSAGTLNPASTNSRNNTSEARTLLRKARKRRHSQIHSACYCGGSFPGHPELGEARDRTAVKSLSRASAAISTPDCLTSSVVPPRLQQGQEGLGKPETSKPGSSGRKGHLKLSGNGTLSFCYDQDS